MSKKYTFDLKLRGVKMYIYNGIGSTTIAKKLNLSDKSRVLLLVKRYNEFGEEVLKERRGKYKGPNKGRPRKEELSLEDKIKKLNAEN